METERYCKLCQRELSTQNPGSICVICQDKITKTFDDKPYYDVEDLQRIFGLSAEHVRRLSRAGRIPGRMPVVKEHHFSKSVIDRWIEANHICTSASPRRMGPLQEEAYRLCQKGDHSWLTDERFLGQACTSKTSSKIKNNMVQMSTTFKCYFCGHKEVRSLP
jgi:hypothetical protein